jgi:hypothetical protein
MNGVEEPTDALADEKKAMLRCYLYLPDTLYGTPTVVEECEAIPDPERRELHSRFFYANFDVVEIVDASRVSNLVSEFNERHAKINDCKVVAEAIVGGADILITFDSDMTSKLSPVSEPMRIMSPSAFWASLEIPNDATPDKVPHHSNPLSAQAWWKW